MDIFGKLGWIILIISTTLQCGSCLFFVQVEHQLSWNLFNDGSKPYIVKVSLDSDDAGRAVHSISYSNKRCPPLTIDAVSGNVKLKRLTTGNPMPNTCSYIISAKLEGQVGQRNQSEASMTLTLNGMNGGSSDCSALSKEQLCYNGMKEINVQILENNRDKAMLAVFGQEMKRCGNMKLKYNIIISEPNVLSIEENSEAYTLWVKAQLDREEKPTYNFTIECSWVSESGTVETSIPGKLTVLDENDNGPKTQEFTTYEIYDISFLQTNNVFKANSQVHPEDTTKLLVIDKDTMEVNRLVLHVTNDTWNLLKVETKTLRTVHNVSATAVLLVIVLTEEANVRKAWTGRYCVEARLNDTALVRNLDSSLMIYLICLHWGEPHSQVHIANVLPSQIVHESPVCSQDCVIYASSGAAVCLVALFLLVVCGRSRLLPSKRRKCIPVKPGGLLGHGIIVGDDYSGHLSAMPELEYMSPGATMGVNSLQFQETDMYMMVDPKWEVARSSLILEQVLGEGEFGRVLKGRLKGLASAYLDSAGLNTREGLLAYTNVAVKMLKDNHVENGKSSRQEFMAEFVLLKQVDHPNVIKLLGACTTAGGPLYLIMEYAELGSLRSFLRKCRRVESFHSNTNDESLLNVALESSKYVVTPSEVLGFSWQIAKGMTYLSDMKMVHRDLAARNILLTQSKVCKISDFGLTRDIYVDDAYKKKSKDRVPVKWLAPECLADELYTTKSDVWAYGILLWELATLGLSPYPGIQTEQIYTLLKSGYRMQQPHNCSFELYSLMRTCWASDPVNRPNFREIGLSLSKLLEDGIDYLKLDIPLVSNPGYQYFNEGQQDRGNTTLDQQIPEISFENTRLITPQFAAPDNMNGFTEMGYTNIHPAYINYESSAEELAPSQKQLSLSNKSNAYESPIKFLKD